MAAELVARATSKSGKLEATVSTGNPELRGTGHHLSAEELRAWTRFLDASRLLEDVLARHLLDEQEISHSEYEILVRLDGAGGKMRLATLADQCVSSKSRLSHTLDRCERRELITRESVAEDRRGLNAVLTKKGSKALAQASPKHAELIRRFLLDSMSDEDLPVVADVMERMATSIRAVRTPDGRLRDEGAPLPQGSG